MAENRYELNKNLAQMLKGGVIMDVTTPEQAKIAEAAGACAVMALERIPADIRAAGPLPSTLLTNRRFSPLRMTPTTLINGSSRCPLCAARETWGKPFGGSMKGPP